MFLNFSVPPSPLLKNPMFPVLRPCSKWLNSYIYPYFPALHKAWDQILAEHPQDSRHLRRPAPRVHLPTHGGLRVSIRGEESLLIDAPCGPIPMSGLNSKPSDLKHPFAQWKGSKHNFFQLCQSWFVLMISDFNISALWIVVNSLKQSLQLCNKCIKLGLKIPAREPSSTCWFHN